SFQMLTDHTNVMVKKKDCQIRHLPLDKSHFITEIQRIYRKYTERKDRDSNLKQIEDDWERYKRISNTIKKYGFKDVEFHKFRSVRKFDSIGYINLLNTYSDHRLMKEQCKNEF